MIADLASHVLDLTEHLIGPLASVMAASHIAFQQRPSLSDPARNENVDAEDCVSILARTHSGALGTLEATKLATGSEDELRLEIYGTRGALRFNGMNPHHLEFHDATAADQPQGGLRGWHRIDTGQRYPSPAGNFPSPKAAMGWIRTHAACLANFLQAVADRRAAEPGLQQGIRVQHLMECVRRSANERCWVETVGPGDGRRCDFPGCIHPAWPVGREVPGRCRRRRLGATGRARRRWRWWRPIHPAR